MEYGPAVQASVGSVQLIDKLHTGMTGQYLELIATEPGADVATLLIFLSHAGSEQVEDDSNFSVSTPPIIDLTFKQTQSGDKCVDILIECTRMNLSVPFILEFTRFILDSLPLDNDSSEGEASDSNDSSGAEPSPDTDDGSELESMASAVNGPAGKDARHILVKKHSDSVDSGLEAEGVDKVSTYVMIDFKDRVELTVTPQCLAVIGKLHAAFTTIVTTLSDNSVTLTNDVTPSSSVTLLSKAEVRNETSYPIGIHYKKSILESLGFPLVGESTNPFGDTHRVAIVEPDETFNVPLTVAHHCKLFIQPSHVDNESKKALRFMEENEKADLWIDLAPSQDGYGQERVSFHMVKKQQSTPQTPTVTAKLSASLKRFSTVPSTIGQSSSSEDSESDEQQKSQVKPKSSPFSNIQKSSFEGDGEVDFEKMHMTKPFFGELRRRWVPAVWVQYRRSVSYSCLHFKTHLVQVRRLLILSDVRTVTTYFERKGIVDTKHNHLVDIVAHYTSQLMPQLHVMMFNLDILSNPYSLVTDFTDGLGDLYYEPSFYQIDNSEEYSEGLSIGAQILMGHVKTTAGNSSSLITTGIVDSSLLMHLDDETKKGVRPYSPYEAAGKQLLNLMNKGHYSDTDVYWTHAPLGPDGKTFLLVTVQSNKCRRSGDGDGEENDINGVIYTVKSQNSFPTPRRNVNLSTIAGESRSLFSTSIVLEFAAGVGKGGATSIVELDADEVLGESFDSSGSAGLTRFCSVSLLSFLSTGVQNLKVPMYSYLPASMETYMSIPKLSLLEIEYDAYRTDLELLAQAPRNEATAQRLEEAQQAFDSHKENFEKLRSDLTVKLKFLDENRPSESRFGIRKREIQLCECRKIVRNIKMTQLIFTPTRISRFICHLPAEFHNSKNARMFPKASRSNRLFRDYRNLQKERINLLAGFLLLAVAAAADDKKTDDKKPSAAPDDKKQTKRGLWDLGIGGWNSEGWSSGGWSSGGWDNELSLSSGWDAPLSLPSSDHGIVNTITIQKQVAVPVPQPYAVPVEKRIPYPVHVPVHVPVDRPVPVAVPKPYPVTVEKHIPYPVDRPVPYPVKVPVKVAVPAPYPVAVPKPYAVPVEKHIAVPVPQPILVKKPVPVLIKEPSGWAPPSSGWAPPSSGWAPPSLDHPCKKVYHSAAPGVYFSPKLSRACPAALEQRV
ncbi:unnamed protein product [Nesidiocoris tenuis]|uniref:AH domain-containing protein n=1 Tax=Nesidiocoris tenuis TaxID=355587 RepID=A0A6H5GSK7_9HEMI|nr:unnamed protein product [Nesidiocoris tenuis]